MHAREALVHRFVTKGLRTGPDHLRRTSGPLAQGSRNDPRQTLRLEPPPTIPCSSR